VLSLGLHGLVFGAVLLLGPLLPQRPKAMSFAATTWAPPEEKLEVLEEDEPDEPIEEIEEVAEPELPELEELNDPPPEKKLAFGLELLEKEQRLEEDPPRDLLFERILPPKKPEPVVAKPVEIQKPTSAPKPPVSSEPSPRTGSNHKPEYPPRAVRLGLEGEVRIKVRVDGQGNVAELEVSRSSGSRLLDNAALRAVKEWKFDHGPGTTEVTVEFELQDRR
jgi:protein TonB